jgi:acyl homoserine lactone synthase
MEFAEGVFSTLSHELVTRLARYRHHVFVERLGWPLPTRDGLEFDQFDRPDTLHVIALKDEQRIVGSARLLPTTRPYLLGEVFPQLLCGSPVPRSDDVWELSRFAALDPEAAAGVPEGQFSSPVAVALLKAALHAAARQRAKRVITVSPLGVERLLRKAGFRARRAGPPMLAHGQPVFACWIDTH